MIDKKVLIIYEIDDKNLSILLNKYCNLEVIIIYRLSSSEKTKTC